MIDVCGLGDVLLKDVGHLSRGYRQRVGLAQSMIHEPPILVLDEPTSGLDPNQIVEIRSLIKEIGREKTVILSTHILPEVEATCDHVLVIHRGELVVATWVLWNRNPLAPYRFEPGSKAIFDLIQADQAPSHEKRAARFDTLDYGFDETLWMDSLGHRLRRMGLSQRPEAAIWIQNTDQVAAVLKLANDHKVPVTPRGAGTALTGLASS